MLKGTLAACTSRGKAYLDHSSKSQTKILRPLQESTPSIVIRDIIIEQSLLYAIWKNGQAGGQLGYVFGV